MALAFVLCLAADARCSSGQHDHITDDEAGSVVVTVWTAETEAFVEYPHHVAGTHRYRWLIHLTRRSDFQAVTEARLTLTVGSAMSEPVQARSPGIYSPAIWVPEAGSFPASIVVETTDHRERIELGTVVVHASADDIPEPGVEPSGIALTKEVQWTVPFSVRQAEQGEVRRVIRAQGVIEAATSRVAMVATPVSGILVAGANLNTPVVGSFIQRHAVLATIAPLASEYSYAAVSARAERASVELARMQQLFEAGAVARNRLVDAQIEYRVASAALAVLNGSGSGESEAYEIRAPLSGFVEERAVMAGATVAVGDPLFKIMDPSVVWLRLLLHVRDAAHARSIEEVSFSVEGSTRRYSTSSLVAVGTEVATENRTLPVVFSVPNSDRSLAIGLFANAELSVGHSGEGVVLPSGAVLLEDGMEVVYVQTEGELFERRPVVLKGREGNNLVIESGVEAGEYVVTEGGYNVYLASVSVSGGHAHDH